MGRSSRTEDIGISWIDGLAEGWVFGVQDALKPALDVALTRYVDKQKTKALREKKGKSRDDDGNPYVVFRMAETRGQPPKRSFKEGDVFYEPAHAGRLAWGDALPILVRVVQVTAAEPDNEEWSDGWVVLNILHFKEGLLTGSERDLKMSQDQLEHGLRSGEFPKP